MNEDELNAVREMETKPGYEVVARTEEGEYVRLGPNPWLFVGPEEDND